MISVAEYIRARRATCFDAPDSLCRSAAHNYPACVGATVSRAAHELLLELGLECQLAARLSEGAALIGAAASDRLLVSVTIGSPVPGLTCAECSG